ncbi:MAG: CDP-glycerol glycerophosphotransferase family protein [Petrotogales bacterium]
MRFRKVYEALGGHEFDPSSGYLHKGILVSVAPFKHEPMKDVVRVGVNHGTSNRGQKDFFGPEGKEIFDHYFVDGPKHKWILKKKGHCLRWGRMVKTGNTVTDDYINGMFNFKKAREKMGIKNDKPILMLAPSRGVAVLNDVIPRLEEFKDEYNIIVRPHPYDKITLDNTKKMNWIKRFDGVIHDVMFAADVLMTDSSSVQYDFAVTGKPIVLFKEIYTNTFWDPPKFNMQYHAPLICSKKGDIKAAIEAAKYKGEDFKRVFYNSFWNPGKGNRKIIDWLKKTIEKRWL